MVYHEYLLFQHWRGFEPRHMGILLPQPCQPDVLFLWLTTTYIDIYIGIYCVASGTSNKTVSRRGTWCCCVRKQLPRDVLSTPICAGANTTKCFGGSRNENCKSENTCRTGPAPGVVTLSPGPAGAGFIPSLTAGSKLITVNPNLVVALAAIKN